jgi:RNA polymerase sigma-70 factor (ECF subfamily)
MSTMPSLEERELIAAARANDEDAYRQLVEPHRNELHAHCYRMLGSVHDADDALQDALLRAWRALDRFEGRGALRPWLYKIATNTSLDVINKRPKRTLPIEHGPASDPQDGPGIPLLESVWVEPYPDETLGIEDGYAAPDASYERRESVELAFIAALQHLPANQRAVLILREVLGYSAQEAADMLDTSVASVNSALQRARATVDERLPEQSQQETLRTIGDERLQEIVEQYIEAMNSGDVHTVVSMLAEDATWSMPPATAWYRGLETVADFLRVGPLSGKWRWRRLAANANGQPAVAAYTFDDGAGCFRPFALDVITLEGDRIKEVTAFITRVTDMPDSDSYRDWPDYAEDKATTEAVFKRFGLPTRLD